MGVAVKALVAGWFSYVDGHATAGDVLARDLLCDWLEEQGVPHEVAIAPPFAGGRSLDEMGPAEFTHAFFICGPFGKGELEAHFLRRFAHCRLIGLNLSLDLPPGAWDPFDFLIERDSTRETHPDMLFASRQPYTPIVGVCLVEPHPEADVDMANVAIARLLERHPGARVNIDTRLDCNETGLRSEGEVEALIGRVDVLVTTRLHGMVMALKNGVPPLVIDAVPGGGKIRRQCARIGWPNVLGLDELDDARLDAAFSYALSDEGQLVARACTERARSDVMQLRTRVMEQLSPGGALERNYAARQTPAGFDVFLKNLPRLQQDAPRPPRTRLIAKIRERLRQ